MLDGWLKLETVMMMDQVSPAEFNCLVLMVEWEPQICTYQLLFLCLPLLCFHRHRDTTFRVLSYLHFFIY
ncbi:hypothetical protein L6452_42024 [Arctium lappa]|uniref:Uncharacterized protein n=1 Tax=Arctium lappa TaxID=4217 RepID=A0ACB8XH45_ARCLA|nr:hypothetical protein L6452_42024 [Arctium lappa]